MMTVRTYALLALLLPAIPTQAVAADATTQRLVNELKQLTNQAERDRSASYRLIDQLRDLTGRYDKPWQRKVLSDNFRDGEFLRNPAWYTNSKDFWVARSIGLRTELNTQQIQPAQQPARQPSREEAIIGLILGETIQQQAPVARKQPKKSRADISTRATIGNAFAVTMKLSVMGRGNRYGSFEFGPYQGSNMESGYRLVYVSGARPALKLVSYRRGMKSVLEIYDRGRLLEDGNLHALTWQRTVNATMTVYLDGKQLFKVRDKTYRDAFSGFVMTNRGGDYAVRSVVVVDNRR